MQTGGRPGTTSEEGTPSCIVENEAAMNPAVIAVAVPYKELGSHCIQDNTTRTRVGVRAASFCWSMRR